MSLDIPGRALCQSMLDDYDNMFNTINNAKSGYMNQMNSAINELQNTIDYTPLEEAQSKANSALATGKSQIPDMAIPGAVDEVTNIMKQCAYFPDADLSNVIGAVKKAMNSAFDAAKKVMDTIFDNIPEVDLSKLLNGLLNSISGLKIPELVLGMDKLINCLSAICGTDPNLLDTRMTNLNNLLDEMKLNHDGEFDLETILTDAGVPTDGKESIKEVFNTTQAVTEDVAKASKDAVDAAKKEAGVIIDDVIPPPGNGDNGGNGNGGNGNGDNGGNGEGGWHSQ